MSNLEETSSPATQCVSKRPQLLLRGLDSLYVSYYLDTSTSKVDWDELEFLKERVGRERKEKLAEITLGTETFALKPFGKSPYRYILSNRLFEVRLGERINPSCHVQYSSEGLWTYGAEALANRFLAWTESVDLIQTKQDVVARADWAFDYHLPIMDFGEENIVTRAAKDGSWREHRKYQSFQVGVGDTVVRIYDKVSEIAQASEKTWFYQLWERTDEVWRIEFQVRGERLRSAGISTFKELQDYQGDLLREIASKHTTLRRQTSDANRSRWPLHPLWISLKSDIANMPQTGLAAVIDEAEAISWRLNRSLKSMLGHCKNIAALRAAQSGSDEPPDFDEFMRTLPKLLARHHDAHVWKTDIARKLQEMRLGQ